MTAIRSFRWTSPPGLPRSSGISALNDKRGHHDVRARGPDWIDDLRLRGYSGIYVAVMPLGPGGPNVPDGGNERAIMRYTLTVGLLVCMPTVAFLAVAGVAVLAGNLRHRLGREADHRQPE